MNFQEVATKITKFIFPFFGKSKTIKQIGQEIGTAADNELLILWNSVKGLLIEEYEEATVIDADIEESDVKATIKRKLKKADDTTKASIEKALAQKAATVTKTNTTTITGNNNQVFQDVNNSNIQTHSGTGDNVAGNKTVNHK